MISSNRNQKYELGTTQQSRKDFKRFCTTINGVTKAGCSLRRPDSGLENETNESELRSERTAAAAAIAVGGAFESGFRLCSENSRI